MKKNFYENGGNELPVKRQWAVHALFNIRLNRLILEAPSQTSRFYICKLGTHGSKVGKVKRLNMMVSEKTAIGEVHAGAKLLSVCQPLIHSEKEEHIISSLLGPLGVWRRRTSEALQVLLYCLATHPISTPRLFVCVKEGLAPLSQLSKR